MSFIANAFGLGANQLNGSFQAQGVNQGQLGTAAGQANQGLAQQQAFVNAVNAQNGLTNQSQVYNQMQGTAGQLNQLAQGQGPNPALAQLNQTTGQNIQGQAALQAGQRGASGNVGLMARQIGQQGAGIQQQAAGQAATQTAQQQLGAIGALQSQQANLANLATTQAGQQQGALSAYNQAAQGNQGQLLAANSAQNSVNQQMAQGNQKGAQGLIGGVAGAVSGILGLADGGMVQNYPFGGPVAQVQVGGPQSAVGQYLTSPQMTGGSAYQGGGGDLGSSFKSGQQSGKSIGNFLKPSTPADDTNPASKLDAASQFSIENEAPGIFTQPIAPTGTSDLPKIGDPGVMQSARGGEIKKMAQGGQSQTAPQPQTGISKEQTDAFSAGFNAALGAGKKVASNPQPQPAQNQAHGGKVKAMLSPGERFIPPKDVSKVATGREDPLSAGKRVPGSAKVKGDSLKNDVVPAKLEEGGVVIPRSVMQSKNPSEEARKFVAAIVAKQGMKRGKA